MEWIQFSSNETRFLVRDQEIWFQSKIYWPFSNTFSDEILQRCPLLPNSCAHVFLKELCVLRVVITHRWTQQFRSFSAAIYIVAKFSGITLWHETFREIVRPSQNSSAVSFPTEFRGDRLCHNLAFQCEFTQHNTHWNSTYHTGHNIRRYDTRNYENTQDKNKDNVKRQQNTRQKGTQNDQT